MTVSEGNDANVVAPSFAVMSTPSLEPTSYKLNDGADMQSNYKYTTTPSPGGCDLQSFSQDNDMIRYTHHDSSGTSTPNLLDQVPTSNVPLMAGQNQLHISPSTRVVVPAMPTSNTVPEFLYQLTKMLTDNNRSVIEWSNGRIEVHNPHKLESTVLNRYFRHSKFPSFQRQLNYFGFRKLAGKGKMAPCSYVNDATTSELGSLLLIKRKSGNEPKTKCGTKRDRSEEEGSSQQNSNETAPVNPVLAGILYRSANEQVHSITIPYVPHATNFDQSKPPVGAPQPSEGSQQALARVAVGKGIRHGYTGTYGHHLGGNPQQPSSTPVTSNETPVQASLSALTNNFRNSLQDLNSRDNGGKSETEQALHRLTNSTSTGFIPGMLRRDDSLVDLAMIPVGEDTTPTNDIESSDGLNFVDFPWQEPNASDCIEPSY